jgi:3-oxoacyl-[acyl-carrier protein] reductase
VLLQGKKAIIYGAGAIARAVAAAFAREGAAVYLASRSEDPLATLARDIGAADHTVLDALDERAVDRHADAVAERAGSIDVSFNLISYGDVHGTPLAEMALEDFERPIRTAARSQFLTSRAAARHMTRQGSGVIMFFGGDGGRDPIRDYYIGGFVVALNAIEALRRQLSAELGRHGIRALTLQSGGLPETVPEGYAGRDEIVDRIVGETMLERAATFADVGNVAAFAASDQARTMTATALNITCGTVAD